MHSRPEQTRSVRKTRADRLGVRRRWWALTTFLMTTLCHVSAAERGAVAGSPYQKWAQGPPSDPGFFPLAVWLQAPANAERFRQAGFHTCVGLWRRPTEEHLAALEKSGLRLICRQNEVGLRHRDDSVIIGWMHGDEPDNAQSLGN